MTAVETETCGVRSPLTGRSFYTTAKKTMAPQKISATTSMRLSGHQLCYSVLPGPAHHRSCGRSGSKASAALSAWLRLQERSSHLQRGKPL